MDLKFTPNKISINTAGATTAILKAAEAYMNQTSDKMIEIMRAHIDSLGNGSSTMKADAKAAVREILRDITDEYITLEIGVDEAMARAMSTQFYIRTMVVIHGNQANGPIRTKPGVSTWKKHVDYRSVNEYNKTSYLIPGFDQPADFSKPIVENTIRSIEYYFKDMLYFLGEQIPGIVAAYMTGG